MSNPTDIDRERLDQALSIKTTFDARWEAASAEAKHRIIRAMLDCADTVSRRWGFRPSDFIFGNDEFTVEQVDAVLLILDRLIQHAAASEFRDGVTAASALHVVAQLQRILLTGTHAASTAARLRLNVFTMRMRSLINQHFDLV